MLRLISITVVSLAFLAGNAVAQVNQSTDQSADDTANSTGKAPPNTENNVSQIEKEDAGGVVIGAFNLNSTRSNQSTSVAPVITDSTDVVDEQDSSSTKPVPPNPRTTRSKKTAPVDD